MSAETPQRSSRITIAVIKSLYTLFGEAKWKKGSLPNEKELLSLPAIKSIIAEHGLQAEGLRKKIVRQFNRWCDDVPADARDESAPTNQAVAAFVNSRICDIATLIEAALVDMLEGPLIIRLPWAHGILSSLGQDFKYFLVSRVHELSQIIVQHTAKSGRSSSMALALEMRVNVTRNVFLDTYDKHPSFSTVALLSAAELRGRTSNVQTRHILDFLDRAIVHRIRLSFAPSAGMLLTIPSIRSVPNRLVCQVLYYISGWLLSIMFNESKRDTPISVDLVFFVAKNSITPEQAKELDMPYELVASRTRGSLLYSSPAMYDVVLELEHSFYSVLTMTNLIAFGGSLVSAALDLVLESHALLLALEVCMFQLDKAADEQNRSYPNRRPILELIVNKYFRMRGRDMVKSILSVLRLTKSAKTALSHRAQLAAAATSAAAKRRKQRTSESYSLVDKVDCVDADSESDDDNAVVDNDEYEAMDDDLQDEADDLSDHDKGLCTFVLDDIEATDSVGSSRDCASAGSTS